MTTAVDALLQAFVDARPFLAADQVAPLMKMVERARRAAEKAAAPNATDADRTQAAEALRWASTMLRAIRGDRVVG